ncbi:hypothetical protein [Solitalea koreensis]|uniref:Uncharacterized protein n=1 Tax=Solitalea koreensis TaxID=543615 RepID=A0A521BIF2_9SPHI|nr:hypothetical protein [Solitalea koreensis]SMO46872.1 hypothetical protein SAMN06265350_102223 [Solitalea koreensis]
MLTNSILPAQFTFEIKQTIYHAGTNLYDIVFYDLLGIQLTTKNMYIPDQAEESWIQEKVKELYFES